MPPIPKVAYLCAWACLSVATSTYNKWVLDRLAFNFPMTLSCAHMAGVALVLHAYLAWKRGGWSGGSRQEQATQQQQYCNLQQHRLRPADLEKAAGAGTADSRSGHNADGLTPPSAFACQNPAWWLRHHGRHILPIASMFAASVCLRNSAYAGLPLPVMQLLGSCGPLATYALSIAVGLAPLAWPGLACMVACICGVVIAVSGRSTVPYSGHALARQAAGAGLEVCRSIVLQLLIRKVLAGEGGGDGGGGGGKARLPVEVWATTASPPPPHRHLTAASVKAGPLLVHAHPIPPPPPSSSPPLLPTILLAMYAPVCAVMLALPAAAFEINRALADAAGRPPWFWGALFGNVAIALALNMAAVTCLHKVGAVALSMTGFAKDWGLILVSTVLFGREVSPRFVVGMLVTTGVVGVYGSCKLKVPMS